VEVKQREVKMFADIVEDVKLFSMPKKGGITCFAG